VTEPLDAPGSEPGTWHHGLIARWWSEFNTGGEDVAWFRRIVEEGGQPALDLACGTGRLLVPFLQEGLDVDGCDISEDMLAYCRARAQAEGLSPHLLNQPMHAFEAERVYRTIFIYGSFGIGGTHAHDLATLETAHRHLAPNGTLAFDLFLPNFDPRGWEDWLPRSRPELPMAWHARGEEQYSLRLNIYFKSEVPLMLSHVGFRSVDVQADATGRAAEPYRDVHLMFVARK